MATNLKSDANGMVAQSWQMQRVLKQIALVSQVSSNVLIVGDSGTGKELVARAIHFSGLRSPFRFVPINCSAIPEGLFESELFGHKKGAFTDAIKDKVGLFKVASKGTLFLDEIVSMPLSAQAKLLRAIEFKEIIPVGSTRAQPVDLRIIAATNRDLEQEIEAGRFRVDLYYRINVFEIRLPSLQERVEDIPPLVEHFIARYGQTLNKPIKGIEKEAMEILRRFKWKGAVRELENVIERAMVFSSGDQITIHDLPDYVTKELPNNFTIDYAKPLKEARRDFERHFILTNLNLREGHRSEILRALNLSETSFYRKIDELGIKANTRTRINRKRGPNKVQLN